MKIFLSYPNARKKTAESVNYELQASGHEVFFDKEDLPAGQSYNEKIRSAIEESDLFIFMVTPESVIKGRYTLTELKLASRKWPNPAGRVLPVMLEATRFEDIPAYLKAVTILTPEGNVTAEILIEVADLAAAQPAQARGNDAADSQIESFSYQPIEIRFGRGAAGVYPVAITASPAGILPAQPCSLDPNALESLLGSSASAPAGTTRRGTVEASRSAVNVMPSEEAAKRIGEKLYESLFQSHIQSCLKSSLRSVDPQRRQGLRFLINTTDAPDLARLPWEFLYSTELDDFLFSDRMKPVIRWLDVDQPPPTLVVEPPLRLLIAIAAPQDRPDLSVGEELARLGEALRDLVDQGRVETVCLEHATLEKLDDALLKNKPHALHFIGHGDFVDNDGVIFLEAENPRGAADPITGRRLGVLLRNHLGSLRFVFLNSCLGAAVSPQNPFGGVAQSLIRRGVPAVIAMQFPIPDRVAVALARHFYRYLAAGLPVDAALTSARAFIFARGYPVEWGAPALHMRTPDGRLFEVGTAGRAAGHPLRVPAAETPTPRREAKPSAALPPAAAQDIGKRRSSARRWLWPALGLLAMIAILASVGLFFAQRRGLPDAPSMPPGDLTGAIPTTPQATAEQNYRAALQGLRDSHAPAALRRLEEARRLDSDGSALARSPEIREALFDELLAVARKELAAGNIDVAREAASALMLIDKNRAGPELRKLFPTASREPAPAGASYRVRSGDTLWSIAAAKYGDPTLWSKIYDANRDRIRDPDLIYPNQELILPAMRSAAGATAHAPGRHRVKAGDNLWNIAGAIYGDAALWPRLYNANRDRISDPNLIMPDQELMIPRDREDSKPHQRPAR
ncbi:MAG: CHAT domain-containing protein [Candidatus Binatia bacterium]